MVRKLKKLSMKTEWNQFDKLEIRFHDRVTILTGKNGVGKTSLLRMISRTAYSDQQKELWSGFLEDKDKETINVLKILKNEMPYLFIGTNPAIPKNLVNSLKTRNQNSKENNDNFSTICTIEFSDAKIKLDLPINTNASKEWDYDFDLQIKKSGEEWQYFQPKYSYGNVNIDSYDPGISINSHKFPYVYSKLSYIENGIKSKEEYFSKYLEVVNSQFNITDRRTDITNPHLIVKQSLISLIIYSSQSQYIQYNEKNNLVGKFVDLLKIVLPEELGLENLIFDPDVGELILVTKNGDYLMDSVSSGVGALIDLVWQLFMGVPEEKSYFVVIDELENHLHPSLQRDVLPKLCKAFPNVQFIISTHSPFVVTSIEDAYIYVLDYGENNKVKATLIEDYIPTLSTSVDDALYNILGISSTLPLWAEKRFNDILSKYKGIALTDKQYNELLSDMKKANLESMTNELIYKMNSGVDESDEIK